MDEIKKLGFDDAYAMKESIDTILAMTKEASDVVRFHDYHALLSKKELTPLEIYNKGFSVLDRLAEELHIHLKNHKR